MSLTLLMSTAPSLRRIEVAADKVVKWLYMTGSELWKWVKSEPKMLRK